MGRGVYLVSRRRAGVVFSSKQQKVSKGRREGFRRWSKRWTAKG